MSISMSTPGRFVAFLTYRRDNGTTWTTERDVVAFDEHGHALVAGNHGLERPNQGTITPESWYMETLDRAVIPAQPGWMVDMWDSDFPDAEPHSCPVVAWIYEGEAGRERDTYGKVIYVCPHNREGNVGLDEADLADPNVQVRPATVEELAGLR
jgi:hypothetical protein